MHDCQISPLCQFEPSSQKVRDNNLEPSLEESRRYKFPTTQIEMLARSTLGTSLNKGTPRTFYKKVLSVWFHVCILYIFCFIDIYIYVHIEYIIYTLYIEYMQGLCTFDIKSLIFWVYAGLMNFRCLKPAHALKNTFVANKRPSNMLSVHGNILLLLLS